VSLLFFVELMMLSDFDAAGWLAAFLLCGFVRGADCVAPQPGLATLLKTNHANWTNLPKRFCANSLTVSAFLLCGLVVVLDDVASQPRVLRYLVAGADLAGVGGTG
jgi:hypothetical protein